MKNDNENKEFSKFAKKWLLYYKKDRRKNQPPWNCEDKKQTGEYGFNIYNNDNFLPYEESFGGILKVAKDKLENLDKVNIYGVEHAQGGKLYDFISDEELSIGDFVVCDTCMGKSYGVVKKIEKGVNNNHKKCKKLR